MLSFTRCLMLLASLAAATVTAGVPSVAVVSEPTPVALYSSHDKEFYLTSDEVGYIRPGLGIEVESVTIGEDLKPVVVVSFFDDAGQPLDRAGLVTPGPVSMSFILAWYDGDARLYTAYTVRTQTSPITGDSAVQAAADSGGSWEDLELGRASYTFGTALPTDYDATRTHSLAIYSTRNLQDIIEKSYYANVVYDFRPDGGEVTEVWDAMSDATCNSCHDQLALHGGSRRAVKLCVTCHNAGTVDPDTGNTVDMKVMVHKIHMGANLPSVQAGIPYQIIGYNQSVNDYSEIVLPQDVRNCATCHPEDSPEGHIWYTRPNQAACGSCHDDIDWETGAGHVAGVQPDTTCAFCHLPEGESEFDASVMGAHVVPGKSAQLAGLNMEILEVTGAAPGAPLTVTFRVTNGDGSLVDPASLDRLYLLVGGPTTDYTEYFRETATGATVVGDVATYTFSAPLPASASGTWAVSADVRRVVTLDDGSPEGLEVREAAFNPVVFFEVGGGEVSLERRQVVVTEKCNVCHDRLAFHGSQRLNVQECLICHNPVATDEEEREPEEMPAESIHFKWMIHRIHTGNELLEDYTIGGGDGANFNSVGYPGDRRNCQACHEAGTYGVPLPEGTLETPTDRSWYTPMMPAAAACLACHSSVDAAAHAYVNTAPFGEACAACHGDDREFSVERVHAR